MKVLYDNQIFAWQKFGGISRYFVELMNNCPSDIECKLPATFSDNCYLRQSISFPDFKGKMSFYRIADKFTSIRSIRKTYDIFHPTYYNPYFLSRLKSPYVITVHDMIHERFPQMFADDGTIEFKLKSITNANRIIAISEYTKKDIMEIYGIDSSKIDVVYHGVSLFAPTRPKSIPEKYILFTGQRLGYKNFDNLCIAFAKIIRYFPDISLVCTGNSFTEEEIAFLNKLNIRSNTHHMFASDSELAYLYKHAECFVFPSLYEGFGIPILEAFGYNCPLCLSSASCFPEIAGNGGMYFDGKDPDSIATMIMKVLSNPEVRNKLIENGKKRLNDFSWGKMAFQTSLSYKRVLNG